MASSALAKYPCCKRISYSELSSFLPHMKDYYLKLNDKDADHNNQTSTKYTVSYKCSMCQSSLESQLKVLQHITNRAPDYAKHLGLDDPSLVSDLSDSTPTVGTVFSFNDKDWVVSQSDVCCRQTLTRRYVSNTSYFTNGDICGNLLIAKWDEIYSRKHKKATTNRDILNMNGLDYIVTRGKDYTIDKHIKQQFAKVGYTPSAKEIADVIQNNFELYKDLVRTSPKKVKFLIWKFVLYLIGSDSAYDHVTITKYTDLGSSTNLKVREIGYKSHAYVMDKLKQRSWECAPLLAKLIDLQPSIEISSRRRTLIMTM